MSRLLDEMATRYSDRILVFDAPPLLLSTESRALASQVGQVVLVVEADRTTQAHGSRRLA
jgi:protein-tyrosine kinase